MSQLSAQTSDLAAISNVNLFEISTYKMTSTSAANVGAPLPPGWTAATDPATGDVYYQNNTTTPPLVQWVSSYLFNIAVLLRFLSLLARHRSKSGGKTRGSSLLLRCLQPRRRPTRNHPARKATTSLQATRRDSLARKTRRLTTRPSRPRPRSAVPPMPTPHLRPHRFLCRLPRVTLRLLPKRACKTNWDPCPKVGSRFGIRKACVGTLWTSWRRLRPSLGVSCRTLELVWNRLVLSL